MENCKKELFNFSKKYQEKLKNIPQAIIEDINTPEHKWVISMLTANTDILKGFNQFFVTYPETKRFRMYFRQGNVVFETKEIEINN